MMVRFATKCDRCDERSDEYTAWPTCRECMDDICPRCEAHSTRSGGDGEPVTVLCRMCQSDYNMKTP